MPTSDEAGATPHGGCRRKVLLLAYACSPYRGSESAVGWHRAREIAKSCDTWVLCQQQRYEADIRRYFTETPPIPGLQFHFIPSGPFERFLKRIPGFWYLTYNLCTDGCIAVRANSTGMFISTSFIR